jgi:transcriptional regulator with XRE-family HTH domain
MTLTGPHVTAARGLLRLTQAQLASASGVSEQTINGFERGKTTPHDATLSAIREALERRGIEFYNGGEPGVRLRPSKAIIPP